MSNIPEWTTKGEYGERVIVQWWDDGRFAHIIIDSNEDNGASVLLTPDQVGALANYLIGNRPVAQ